MVARWLAASLTSQATQRMPRHGLGRADPGRCIYPYQRSRASSRSRTFSPDGRWIATSLGADLGCADRRAAPLTGRVRGRNHARRQMRRYLVARWDGCSAQASGTRHACGMRHRRGGADARTPAIKAAPKLWWSPGGRILLTGARGRDPARRSCGTRRRDGNCEAAPLRGVDTGWTIPGRRRVIASCFRMARDVSRCGRLPQGASCSSWRSTMLATR